MEQIETTIRDNQYKSELEIDDLFYFGNKTLGDGNHRVWNSPSFGNG
jgi:hypothetical protein